MSSGFVIVVFECEFEFELLAVDDEEEEEDAGEMMKRRRSKDPDT